MIDAYRNSLVRYIDEKNKINYKIVAIAVEKVIMITNSNETL